MVFRGTYVRTQLANFALQGTLTSAFVRNNAAAGVSFVMVGAIDTWITDTIKFGLFVGLLLLKATDATAAASE